MHGCNHRTEVLAFRRNDPEAARTGNVKVAELIDFHPIERVFTGRRGHVEKHDAVRYRAFGMRFVTHNDLLTIVPVGDVEVLLVGRESDAIRTGKVLAEELKF